MKLLHLSDFHWKKSNFADQEIVIRSLLKDPFLTAQKGQIDLLVFSGDLVYSADDVKDFSLAYEQLIVPLQDMLTIPDERILICPGNHDISQKSVDDIIENGLFSTLTNSEKLNEYIDKNIDKTSTADTRLSNYFAFRDARFHKNAIRKNMHFDSFIYNIDGLDVGFVVFNTAWRSTGIGEKERHKILLGERAVDQALADISTASIKIAVMHHPLDWLAAWDQYAVEIPLISGFDVALYGHVHTGRPSQFETPLGKAIFLQSGAIFTKRDYFNGYAVIEINREDKSLRTSSRVWQNSTRVFAQADNVCPGGVIEFALERRDEKDKLPSKSIQGLREAIRHRANAHIQTLIVEPNISFENIFATIPLSEKTSLEMSSLAPNQYNNFIISIEDAEKKRGATCVFGDKESGKTMLSLMLAKLAVEKSDQDFRIPIFVEFGDLSPKSYKTVSINSVIQRSNSLIEFECSSKTILDGYRCLFLVDNINPVDNRRMEVLKGLIEETKDAHDWVFMLEDVKFGPYQAITKALVPKCHTFFILPLSRGNLREAVSKIPSTLPNPKAVEETVIRTITVNHLPKTHYIATLIVLAIKNNRLSEVINEATLVENFIDVVLKKGDFSQIFRGPTDFKGQSILLENMAFWLDEAGGTLSENEMLARVTKYYTERGIYTGASEIIRRFIEVGLCEIVEQEIRFRFPVVCSFFLASYASKNPDFITKMFENENITTYHRDIDFLADILRSDTSLIEKFEGLTARFRPGAFSSAIAGGFLAEDEETDSLVAARFEATSRGPKTKQEIDLAADFSERAFQNSFGHINEGEADEKGIKSVIGLMCYIQGYTGWGRALSALDFTELSIRKPSLRKLLREWDLLSTFLTNGARDFVEKIGDMDEVKRLPDALKQRFKYMLTVQSPIVLAKIAFRIPGLASLHQMLTETFDDPTLNEGEKVGMALLLMQNRPRDWANRIKAYLPIAIEGRQKTALKIVCECGMSEYQFSQMSADDRSSFEEIIAEIMYSRDKRIPKNQLLASIRKGRLALEARLTDRI